jgi:hypothetical protein
MCHNDVLVYIIHLALGHLWVLCRCQWQPWSSLWCARPWAPLLSAVIKETLRVCAPAPFGGTRWVVQEEGVDMCGYNVPKVSSLTEVQCTYILFDCQQLDHMPPLSGIACMGRPK